MNSRDESVTPANAPLTGQASSDSHPLLSGVVLLRATDLSGVASASCDKLGASGAEVPLKVGHLAFPDGVRGLAALYVVFHHIWLTTYPAFPKDTGPAWASWMLWGHLAVALFIVVSGFSLTLAPQRNGDRLSGGFSTYIRRRAFRILPPYWVALVVSCLVIETFTGRYTGQFVTVKSVAVHTFLLQDVIRSPSPNGAFWSVAIEWQIYFLFPLVLMLWRRLGGTAMVVLVTIVVVAGQLAGTNFRFFSKILHLTPQFLALFAFGVAAAHVLVAKERFAAVPWTSIGLALTGTTVFVLCWWEPQQVEAHFFWVDLLAGAATAALLAGCAQHPEGRVARLLSTRFARWLGQSSYSLYLIHLPVLGLVYWGMVVRLSHDNDTRFLLLLLLGTPMAVLVSRLFWRIFEWPFMKHRSFRELAGAWRRVPGA